MTFKITNVELTNIPASHGQWGGYRTTKALAWVINIGPNSWLARCGNQACGPSTFPHAKADALAMAKGAVGDYFIDDPIRHLNELQSRVADEAAVPFLGSQRASADPSMQLEPWLQSSSLARFSLGRA